MSDSNPLDIAERFLAQTRELLALAEADDWAEFKPKMAERQALMPQLQDEQLLQDALETGQVEALRERIQKIQQLNDRLGELAQAHRDQIAGQLKDQKVKDKAVNAYQKQKP